MKNLATLVTVVVFGLFSISSHAQIFGIKGGVGLANISSPDPDEDKLFGKALGVKLGGTIEFDITDNLYIGSGLGFAKKGASTNSGNYNTYYIELPVSARYDIVELGGAGYLYVASGFNLGVMMAANRAGTKVGIGTAVDDFFKPLDFGANFGLGVIFDDRFEVGVVSEFGLTNIYANNLSNLKNVSLLVSFGYKFGM